MPGYKARLDNGLVINVPAKAVNSRESIRDHGIDAVIERAQRAKRARGFGGCRTVAVIRPNGEEMALIRFEDKVEKSREIADRQKAVKTKMDGLIWKQHSQFPKSWTEERNARIAAMGVEYDRLGAEYRAVWSS